MPKNSRMSGWNFEAIQNHGYIVGVKMNPLTASIYVVLASENIVFCSWMIKSLSTDTNIDGSEQTDDNCRTMMNTDISFVFHPKVVFVITKIIHKHLAMDVKNNLMPSSTYTRAMRRGAAFWVGNHKICLSFVGCSTSDVFLIEIEDLDIGILENFSNLSPRLLEATTHVGESQIILSSNAINLVNESISIESTVELVCSAALEIFDGYDTAIVFRFRDDNSSEIIHQCVESSSSKSQFEREANSSKYPCSIVPLPLLQEPIESWTSTPESRIPRRARDSLLMNGFRVIYNVNGGESKVVRCSDDRVDLSMLSLCAVSECDLAYLRKIGVHSSLTISIIVDGVLWGLYVFHSHSEGKTLKSTFEQQALVESIVTASASRIFYFLVESRKERKENIIRVASFLPELNSADDFLTLHHEEILSLLDCHCIEVLRTDHGIKFGKSNAYGDHSIMITQTGYNRLVALKDFKINAPAVISDFIDGMEGVGIGVILFKMSETTSVAFIRRKKVLGLRWVTDNYLYDDSISDSDHDSTDSMSPNELAYESGQSVPDDYTSNTCTQLWSSLDIELCQHIFYQYSQASRLETVARYRLSLAQSDAKCLSAIENTTRNNEFFAHMSHELRTPFHGIMSSLQILKSGGPTISERETADLIDGALECSESMLGILDDILSITKYNQSMRSHDTKVVVPLDLSELISSITRRIKPIADEKGVKFMQCYGELTLENEHVSIEDIKLFAAVGDEASIFQIASNLTSNAIKFTATGGSVSLKVSFVSTSHSQIFSRWEIVASKYSSSFVAVALGDEPSTKDISEVNSHSVPVSRESDQHSQHMHPDRAVQWLIIDVQDTGCGVNSDSMKIMFDAYQQISTGVNKTYQGTGLGLHVVRMHIQTLSGMLAVASTLNFGTHFFCAFPLWFHATAVTGTESLEVVNSNCDDDYLNTDTNLKKESSTLIIDSNPVLSHTSTQAAIAERVLISSEPLVQAQVQAVDKPTFLVVDDSKTNIRLLLKKITMVLGDSVECLTALDGNAAVAIYKTLVRDGRYKLLAGIFMDYHMPNCNGVDAIAQIRSIEKLLELRPAYIIGFSADVSDESTACLTKSGANSIIAKPSPAGQVEDTCRRLTKDLLVANQQLN